MTAIDRLGFHLRLKTGDRVHGRRVAFLERRETRTKPERCWWRWSARPDPPIRRLLHPDIRPAADDSGEAFRAHSSCPPAAADTAVALPPGVRVYCLNQLIM